MDLRDSSLLSLSFLPPFSLYGLYIVFCMQVWYEFFLYYNNVMRCQQANNCRTAEQSQICFPLSSQKDIPIWHDCLGGPSSYSYS